MADLYGLADGVHRTSNHIGQTSGESSLTTQCRRGPQVANVPCERAAELLGNKFKHRYDHFMHELAESLA